MLHLRFVANRHETKNNVVGVFLQRVIHRRLVVGLGSVVVDAQPAAHVNVLQACARPLQLHIHTASFRQDVLDLTPPTELDKAERLDLGDFAVGEIKVAGSSLPAFREVPLEILEDGVAKLLTGGLRPATTHAAFIASHLQFKQMVLTALQSLGTCGHGTPAVWLLASVASTTGRGIMTEAAMTLHEVLRELHLPAQLTAVVVDAEGLIPPQRQLRQMLEGAFYRELEAVTLASPHKPIPRPHTSRAWQGGRPLGLVVRMCGSWGDGNNLSSLDELSAHVTDWFRLSVATPVVQALVCGPSGDRGRRLPTVPPDDGHALDPRQRCFAVSGIAALLLDTPTITAFSNLQGADYVLERVLGPEKVGVDHLVRELRLDFATLANSAGEPSFVSNVGGQMSMLEKTLTSLPPAQWRGAINETLARLSQSHDQMANLVLRRLGTVMEEIQKNVETKVASFLLSASGAALGELGLHGAERYLLDVESQMTRVKNSCGEVLANPCRLSDVHLGINEKLKDMSIMRRLLNRGGVRNELLDSIRGPYQMAVKIVVANGILATFPKFEQWLTEMLGNVSGALNRIKVARNRLETRRQQALAERETGCVLPLASGEFEVMALLSRASAFDAAYINASATAMLDGLAAKHGDAIKGLSALGDGQIEAAAAAEFEKVCPSATLVAGQMAAQFHARFPDEESRAQAIRWLAWNARPLSGTIDPLLPHRLGVPACRYRSVLVAGELIEAVMPALTACGFSQAEIRKVEGVPGLVIVVEELGLPGHAFPHVVAAGGQVPSDPRQRAMVTTTRSAQTNLPPIINRDPTTGLDTQDLLALGMVAGAITRDASRELSVDGDMPLGPDTASAHRILASNGHASHLRRTILQRLSRSSSDDLDATRAQAVADGLEQTAALRACQLARASLTL